MHNIVEEQYLLAKHVNISIFDSLNLPVFECEAYLSLIERDLKREVDNMPHLGVS